LQTLELFEKMCAMRRRLFLLIVFAFTGFVLVAWLTRPTHRINRDSFAKIHAGMSKEAVEATLNCAPGEYSATPLAKVAGHYVIGIGAMKRDGIQTSASCRAFGADALRTNPSAVRTFGGQGPLESWHRISVGDRPSDTNSRS
jgi:hypothetical protein